MASDLFNKNDYNDNKEHVWPAQTSQWSKAFEGFASTLFKIYCPLTVHHAERLPKMPFLVASNHTSHIDSAMLMAATHLHFNEIGLIAAKDYFFETSHRSFLQYMMNLVPIARGSGPGAIDSCIAVSRAFLRSGGKALIIYPEGTRAVSQNIGSFKQGAAILARELDIPLVPALVSGSFKAMPKGSYLPRPTRLSVRFGEPFLVSNYVPSALMHDRKAIFHAYREATIELEKRVRELAREEAHA